MLMPFGKYKGKPIDSIPCGYLKWILANCELREPLKTAIRSAYLYGRKKSGPAEWDVGFGKITVHTKIRQLYLKLQNHSGAERM